MHLILQERVLLFFKQLVHFTCNVVGIFALIFVLRRKRAGMGGGEVSDLPPAK